jgi:hypothetical protein
MTVQLPHVQSREPKSKTKEQDRDVLGRNIKRNNISALYKELSENR